MTMTMPIYLQILFAAAMILVIFVLIIEIYNRFTHYLKKPSRNHYMLVKETLEKGIIIYTLEISREGLFKWLAGDTLLLKHTFDVNEANGWASMFGIEIEDIDTE